uniref:Cell division protein n=1 Tax=Prototheca cutis TaxID=575411 RepID=A0A2Z6BET4_9CHLO|nr:cell division protein [Prototheca cutis]BBD20234.1 cell division protein [Prototheca cutis]
MGYKYEKIERFKSKIPFKYSPQEIREILGVSFKKYIIRLITINFILLWKNRNKFKPTFDLQLFQIKEFQKYSVFFLNNIKKGIIYWSLPIWYIVGCFYIIKTPKLTVLIKQKIEVAVHLHRLRMNKKLTFYKPGLDVILSLSIFAFAFVQYVFIRYKPFQNPTIFENHLPLLCYPMETIKWETLMTNNIALKILVEENNYITLFDDYLLIKRPNQLNLFGNRIIKDPKSDNYWVSRPKKIQKISEIFDDLDELPQYLESAYKTTEEKPDFTDQELEEFLTSSTTLEFQNYYKRKRRLAEKKALLNQKIRNLYEKTPGFLKLVSRLQDLNQINFNKYRETKEYLEEELTEDLNENLPLQEVADKNPNKLNFSFFKLTYDRFDYLKLRFIFETLENLVIKWKNIFDFNKTEEIENNTKKVKDPIIQNLQKLRRKKNLRIIRKFLNFSNIQNTDIKKELEGFSTLKEYNNINFSFIENPAIQLKMQEIFNKNKKLFISCVDTSFTFQTKNQNLKIPIQLRKKSGYRYPDLKIDQVFLQRIRDYFLPNRKTTLIKVELPENLMFTKSFIPNLPEEPDLENYKIAADKPLKNNLIEEFNNLPPSYRQDLDILRKGFRLKNHMSTDYDPYRAPVDAAPDDLHDDLEDALIDFDPSSLKDSYKGPAASVNENSDAQIIFDNTIKNVKPFITRSSGTLMLNIPSSMAYFSGKSLNLKQALADSNIKEVADFYNIKLEYPSPEESPLRTWLLNYNSPDNPLLSENVAFNDDAMPKIDRKSMLEFRHTDAMLAQALFEEKLDFITRIRAERSDKIWKIFPYFDEVVEHESLMANPAIPSKKYAMLIGISSNGWLSRYPTSTNFSQYFSEIASRIPEFEEEDTTTRIENEVYVKELMGYAITRLPAADIYLPKPKEVPNLEYGLVNEIDYSPLARILFRKISSFNFDLETTRYFEEEIGNKAIATLFPKREQTRKLTIYSPFIRTWEPLSANSWLVISQVAFVYLCFLLIQETALNYSREFISSVLDVLSEGGIVSPMVIEELKILIGEKDPGFRVARDFTKKFHNIVGFENYGYKLLDTFFYLRFGLSDPILAKNSSSLLLIGPPGTGKTLVVQALAREAKVPVLTLTAQGSNEPPALERLFQEARKLAPCIVFLDEIDSIGQRRSHLMGEKELYSIVHDEQGLLPESGITPLPDLLGRITDPRLIQNKEALHMKINSTVQNYLINENDREYYRIGMLSKLLIELDGSVSRDGVVIIGATNRVEVLDPALLRPGRFYKHIHIGLPTSEKRLQLLKYYSDTLGADSSIPWDYLVNITYGFSAADIATIMNESSIQAISNSSIHSLETIEYGIQRITTVSIEKPASKHKLSYDTLHNAYYQAGKALLGTLLKYHPPIRVAYLWYRHNSLRYNKILQTIQTEWLRYVCRGELEHRIIGAFGGKVGEYMFFQNQTEYIDASNISDMGKQDWKVAQTLVSLLIDQWHLYDRNILFQKYPEMILNHNNGAFGDIGEQYMHEYSQFYEQTPTAIELLGDHADKNPQTRFPLSWWQMKAHEEFLFTEIQKWFYIWLDDPEEWRFNVHWVPPDKTFHRNMILEKVSTIINMPEFSALARDYQMHSIFMESFNLAFIVLNEYRELLDHLAYVLTSDEILREYTIYEICKNYGINCDNLKEDLLNTETEIGPLPKYKILYKSWGFNSAKPKIHWLDIAGMLGESHDFEIKEKEINIDVETNIDIEVNDKNAKTSDNNEQTNIKEQDSNQNTDKNKKRLGIHILNTYYPNIIKKNNYIFSKKRKKNEQVSNFPEVDRKTETKEDDLG